MWKGDESSRLYVGAGVFEVLQGKSRDGSRKERKCEVNRRRGYHYTIETKGGVLKLDTYADMCHLVDRFNCWLMISRQDAAEYIKRWRSKNFVITREMW